MRGVGVPVREVRGDIMYLEYLSKIRSRGEVMFFWN